MTCPAWSRVPDDSILRANHEVPTPIPTDSDTTITDSARAGKPCIQRVPVNNAVEIKSDEMSQEDYVEQSICLSKTDYWQWPRHSDLTSSITNHSHNDNYKNDKEGDNVDSRVGGGPAGDCEAR